MLIIIQWIAIVLGILAYIITVWKSMNLLASFLSRRGR